MLVSALACSFGPFAYYCMQCDCMREDRWYLVTLKDFEQHGCRGLAQYFGNSPSRAVCTTFPGIEQPVAEAYFVRLYIGSYWFFVFCLLFWFWCCCLEFDWQLWRFHSTSLDSSLWNDMEAQRKCLNWIG